MSRQSFLIPRKGTASQISNLTADAASQVDNEFFIDQSTKELYVGTGSNSYNGVQTGQLSCTLNIPEAATATVALFNVRTTFYVLFATRNK